jgi:hypothetical protein|tara:strand:- start:77 stop:514 length:438 start_codon:yes stop_codon:yes gene_type:complete
MASFNKVNDFVANAVHNMDLASDQITLALSNTAPSSESPNPTTDGNGTLSNVTQISYTNASSRNVSTSSSGQSSGVYKLVLSDLTITASGGNVGPFRYIYIYDDTVTSPADPLIGYYDYGSSLTLNDGDSFTTDFSAANGVLQLT